MEISGGDTSATAMQERGPNLHGYKHDFHLAATLQSLCQATVWLLDVLPQLSAIPPCFQIQLLSYC